MEKKAGFLVEYAKSSRSTCKSCSGTIMQDTMRIGEEVPSERHDGFDIQYHHYECCAKGWGPKFKSINDLRDWEYLRWEDQGKIRKVTGEKLQNNDDEKRREKEWKELWELKDDLESNLKSKDLKALLEGNGIEVAKASPARMLHKVADGMLWGVIGPCPTCKNQHSLRYTGMEYVCKGWISGFTRCDFHGTDGVVRYKWKIPDDLKGHKWLAKWKFPKGHPTKPLPSGKEEEEDEEESKEEEEEEEEVEDDGSPEEEPPAGQEMWGMTVVIAGTKKDLGMTQDELIELINDHGGVVEDDVTEQTTAMIGTAAEISKKKKTKKVTAALKAKLPILTAEFVEKLCNEEKGVKLRDPEAAKEYIVEGTEWPEGKRHAKKYSAKILEKLKAKEEKEKAKEEARAKKQQEAEEKRKAKRKLRREPKAGSDILKVDPDTGYAADGEILVTYDDEYGYTPYNVMLNVTDISSGQNKFYKMQIVKIKNKKSWHFFIKYGRIGTDIGDQKIYKKGSENAAIQQFEEKFFERTGVKWEDRDHFEKKPGKYFITELDDGNDEEEDPQEKEERRLKRQKTEQTSTAMDVDASKETIPYRVQELVNLIFDKNMMAKTLASMKVDIKKMPLGKIKKSQLKDGYKVLTEIQDLLEDKDKNSAKIKDATNRFYTLIPHDFGRQVPPLIDNVETVKEKMNIIDTLFDIEIATSLTKDQVDSSDPVVQNYKALKAKISPVERDTERYQILESYAYNTHDKSYFSSFDFEVQDIFEIERDGELDRYKPNENMENKMLLWHGSRLTNWVGIISQGLRIAPPEAPKTGYRFGKGVYFADVISKSGSYCFTSNDNPYAVMLLAEVALGKMNELKKDEYMEKPPPGTHCTKALGMAAPDPKHNKKIEVDVTVPCGKIAQTGLRTACSHNEYILYDVAQVHIRYLLRLKFKHKGFGW